jgi:putative pyruvate formate lyase activating enzyme
MATTEASRYVKAFEAGDLQLQAERARRLLQSCRLCPRHCGVNRSAGEVGFCRTADRAWVASAAAHFGEEGPLVGTGGSGTVFFTHCNLGCVFCQNDDISHQGAGEPVDPGELALVLLGLQRSGCHNINLVTPSHVVAQILEALVLAVPMGLTIPLVYNSSGYDSRVALELLQGIVDIYLPDFKFWDPGVGATLCGVPDYPETARAALKAMHRQVGDLVLDAAGVARRGLMTRHLVLPGGLAGTAPIMDFIARELSPATYVNVMSQYRPCGQAREFPALGRRLTREEFQAARAAAVAAGLHRFA